MEEVNIKHIVYLKMCKELAKLSKCSKVYVGSMLVYNGRIISTGVNGAVSGKTNCCDHFKNHSQEDFLKEHSEWSLKHENHSEMNLILFAAKNNIEIPNDSILYCTHEPCDNCLKHIAGVGITTIYYDQQYYKNIKENIFDLSINQIDLNLLNE
jgi:dCMP deaminase